MELDCGVAPKQHLVLAPFEGVLPSGRKVRSEPWRYILSQRASRRPITRQFTRPKNSPGLQQSGLKFAADLEKALLINEYWLVSHAQDDEMAQ